MTHFNEQQLQEIRLLLQQNRKVEAVKYVKDHSDLGLKEAKDYVDQFQNQAQFFANQYASQSSADSDTPLQTHQQELQSLIQQGRKIEAIKIVMDQSQLGLKDAKDLVEELERNPHLDFQHFQSDQDFYQSAHSHYKSIQTNYSTGEIFILYQDGRKERIDEHHPDWDDIMDQFGGESYDSATDYLTAMQTRMQQNTPDSTRHAHTRPSASASPMVGIEDQSKKKRSSLFIFAVVIIIALILYLLSTR
ncbi:50S ribosomal protein L7/L12 [Acinetobacter nematophilus]|uniref:50S ribosomal protein L7/L12 n=1 Tax=Acinetobacter nematophilus TaxID=2994642 RepID=A0A9X3IJ52_9GAMM|nr:50S ribosomal protein L7/L12 [Acinetobacter nematophilus]MCX5469600.1 50S ribosomal protein L7/L12 [Acinetobacter nematophilus]